MVAQRLGLHADLQPTFVGIDELEHRRDISAIRQPLIRFPLRQGGTDLVIPAAFAHELIPNKDFFLARVVSALKTPRENFVVAPPFVHSRNQSFVG